MDERGVEASLGVVLGVVGLVFLEDAQLEDLLSGQQIDLPRVLWHRAGAAVLTRLKREGNKYHIIEQLRFDKLRPTVGGVNT